MSTAAELIHLGAEAFNKKDNVAATRHFAEAVQIDSRNEIAWLWLSSVLDTTSEQRYCLEKALEINPSRQAVRDRMSKLPQNFSTAPTCITVKTQDIAITNNEVNQNISPSATTSTTATPLKAFVKEDPIEEHKLLDVTSIPHAPPIRKSLAQNVDQLRISKSKAREYGLGGSVLGFVISLPSVWAISQMLQIQGGGSFVPGYIIGIVVVVFVGYVSGFGQGINQFEAKCPNCNHKFILPYSGSNCPSCNIGLYINEQGDCQIKNPSLIKSTTAVQLPKASLSPATYKMQSTQHVNGKSNLVTKFMRLLLFTVVVIGLFFWVFVLDGISIFTGNGNSASGSGSDRVTLQVTGSASRVQVTYGEGGSLSQREVTLPWSTQIEVPPFSPVSVVAQNQDDSGSIACKIMEGGTVLQEANSSGAYTVVTCSAMP